MNTDKLISLVMMFSQFVFLFASILFNLQIVGGPSPWEFYIMNGSELLLYILIALSVLAFVIGLFVPKYRLRLAMAESIGIFGFLLSFYNHTVMNMVPFFLISLTLHYLWSPFFQKNKFL